MNIRPLKTTIIGGLVFLVPLAILAVIIAKVFGVMKVLAEPLSAWIPVDSVGGVATANIVTVIFILAICYVAGLVASAAFGKKFYGKLDEKLQLLFPKYDFIKGMTGSLTENETGGNMKAVMVSFDDQVQIAFEVERKKGGLVTVYLPGAPDPWSGALAHVTDDRVQYLDASFAEVIKLFKKVGVGANAILA